MECYVQVQRSLTCRALLYLVTWSVFLEDDRRHYFLSLFISEDQNPEIEISGGVSEHSSDNSTHSLNSAPSSPPKCQSSVPCPVLSPVLSCLLRASLSARSHTVLSIPFQFGPLPPPPLMRFCYEW